MESRVVVVAGVLLVQSWDTQCRSLQSVGVAHVPVGHQLLAVGVGGDEQYDVIPQEAKGLRIGATYELVRRFNQLLRAEHLGGMQPAIDPYDRLAFSRERAGLRVAEIVCSRQAPRNLLVAAKLRVILRRRDDGHQHRSTLGRRSDPHQPHSVRLAIELPPVVDRLAVVGEKVIVANVVTELG